jgi:hypothetical protein
MASRVSEDQVAVQCSCGSVALALTGSPIACVACYCDTCQEGSRRIEALPNAGTVRDLDGGTSYVVYRKDRLTYARGQDLLRDDVLEQSPTTKRVVASCCNSALLMRFDDARHWVPIYRARFSNAPPLQMRICTSFAPAGSAIPNDVPSYPNYSGALLGKLLFSRIAMLFHR